MTVPRDQHDEMALKYKDAASAFVNAIEGSGCIVAEHKIRLAGFLGDIARQAAESARAEAFEEAAKKLESQFIGVLDGTGYRQGKHDAITIGAKAIRALATAKRE